MAHKRATFSEHWYRIEGLRPRLIAAVRAHKQYFRGREWHVLSSPMNQEFLRLDAAAYGFIALLDGRRTVAEAWRIALERFGDDAPTQGEAIQIIGQLYQSNFLQADIPPDSEGLFQRYRKRRNREIQGAVMSFLFPRFPLWDPDHFLNRWVGVFGWLFSWKGMVLWLAILLAGLYALAGEAGNLYNASSGILSPGNLPLLYVAFVLAKAVHEASHAFCCKYYGRQERNSGQVHNTGIMLLLFTPAPYVDASSSWAFRSKWRRIMVGAAGVWAELALASLAAIVWAKTSEGAPLHALAYNLMFVASVSTLLFNGNPLLRYDAYYMLCDWLEMPNLASRGQQYVYYLIKRYVWGVKDAAHQAHGAAEKGIFVFYTLASNIYRLFLLSGILLTIADMAFFVGAILALGALVMWFFVPLGKFIRYLATNADLSRVRFRAVSTTTAFVLAVAFTAGMIPFPDLFLIEGVIESEIFTRVHAGSEGVLSSILPSETKVEGGNTVLAVLKNPDLESERQVLLGKEKEIFAKIRQAESGDPAEVEAARQQLAALRKEMTRVERLRERLQVRGETDGVWVAPRLANKLGKYVKLGDSLGDIVHLDRLVVRSVPGQNSGVHLIAEAKPKVELRVKGRPDLETTATILAVMPSGRKELPSPALGFPAGGETAVDTQDPRGVTADEHVFEIRLGMKSPSWRVLPGQVVVMRFAAADKPLLVQAWRALSQLLQRRFHV